MWLQTSVQARLVVAAQRVAEGVHAGLVVALRKQHLADAIAGQRAQRVGVERLLILGQGPDQVALRHQLLPLQDGDAHLQVGGGFEHPVAGIDADAARPPEGVDHVLGIGADDVDLLVHGFAVGLNAQVDRHAEEVEILVDLADGAEALVVAQPVDGVFVGEASARRCRRSTGKRRAVSCCWLCASATFSKSSVRMELSVYWLSAPLRMCQKALSPTSQRSMWKIMAPFSRVMDWNWGEKGSRRPALESGMVS